MGRDHGEEAVKVSVVLKLLRLAVSAGLIVFLVVRLDVGEIASHLTGLALLPLALAALTDLGMIAIQAWRWDVLLKARGIAIRAAKLIYYYLVSIFFSSFLPTSVGGDVARIVAVSTATDKRADAVASIVVERIMGFFVLLPVSLAALPFVAGDLKEWKIILTAEAAGVLLVAGFLVILIRPVARTVSRVLNPAFGLLARFKARDRLERLYGAVVLYRDSRGALAKALALSFVSRLMWILACYLIGRAFPIEGLSFRVLLLVAPIVELARMVPVSISGIGVREAAFVAMLRQFGIKDSLSFSFGFMVYLIFFLFAVTGGVLYGARSLSRSRRNGRIAGPRETV
jgi:uncharacterized protein (TIRG00374 family)